MEFVTFEIAKKLKEKGFREKCFGYYAYCGNVIYYYIIQNPVPSRQLTFKDFKDCKNIYKEIEKYDAPTISQVRKWLIDEKKIFIAINIAWCYEDENTPFYKNPKMLPILKGYNAGIYNLDNLNDGKMSNKITYFETYEKAALAGIEYVLDNLI